MSIKAKLDYVKTISEEEELYRYIDFYNWDDGFDIPKAIMENPNCTLPIALLMFELADGYSYLESKDEYADQKEWLAFVDTLYHRVLDGNFPKGKLPFTPQLNKVQIYKLKKALPEEEYIFITPIEAEVEEIDWKESEEMFRLYDIFLQGKPDFPAICPVCARKSGHVYLNRNEDSDRGGIWAWCSECNSYVHAQACIPKWWFNPTFIDESKLYAGDADELDLHTSSIDSFVDELLQKYCFSKDVCKYCIRKEYEFPKIDKCPDCGKETMMISLDGPCLILCCSNCGYKVVGASFFPPCSHDELEYTITIKNIEKEKKIRVAKLFGINVKELLVAFRENHKIETILKIDETITLLNGLNELGVIYEVTPDIEVKYPEIMTCKYR